MEQERIDVAVSIQAARNPQRSALITEDRRVTYEQLETRAELLAQTLRNNGVGGGHIIPIRIDRSVNLVISMLAVLKCGAAYSAISLDWPGSRVQNIYSQLNPVAEVLTKNGEIVVERVSPEETVLAGEEFDNDRPACVFFTSGSTGDPKGVVSPHRATMRLFASPGANILAGTKVMVQAAPPSWDAFSLELWGMLINGGSVFLVDGDYLDPLSLRDAIDEHSVDTIWLTASLFNIFVDTDIDCFTGLYRVLSGGEKLSQSHVLKFMDAHPGIDVVNGYGPVESCIFATTHLVSREDCLKEYGIPIGRPVPRTRVCIVDGSGNQILTSGDIGEICISGDGLAVGYVGNERETSKKFRQVFLDKVRTRAYFTGDLGWFDQDGVLNYAGRKDRQVKVRGYRIELDELEYIVEGYEGVTGCSAVTKKERGTFDSSIFIFFTGKFDGLKTKQEIEANVADYLSGVLPKYSMPSRICYLAELPIGENGKIDRRSLMEDI